MADTREYKYKLSLGEIITEKASTDPKLEIFDSKTSTTIGSGAFDICLNGLKFFRKIYEPGLIEAEVSISTISNKDTLPSMDDVKKLFIKRKTKLTITPTDTNVAETLAENVASVSDLFKGNPDDLDAVKKELDRVHDDYVEKTKGVRDKKLEEIEEGYQRYLEAHPEEIGAGIRNEEHGEGYNVTQGMRMFDSE